MDEHHHTLAAAAEAIRAGRLSPTDLVERCLDRIERLEGQVKAWVRVDDRGARLAAEELAAEAAAGRIRGPLHGIPIGIKDIIDVANWPTEAGSPLRKGRMAAADAPVVARLRQAGAILLGKTVTVEFAGFDPPPTRNPWNTARSPGGSSSGSAAAVAAGMCLGALGTQTGGSLVRPSSFCGTACCKPAFGLLPTEGIVPLCRHFDTVGPMARTAADLAVMMEALAPGFQRLETNPPPRLGFVEGWFVERADANVRPAVAAAVGRLEAAGARVEPTTLELDMPGLLDRHWTIMAAEAAAYHRSDFLAYRDSYGPKIATLLDDGLATTAVDFAADLLRQQTDAKAAAQLVETFDALVMPATESTAPPPHTTGTRDFQAVWTYLGLPVVGLPCGLAHGMPVGVQLVGRPYDEARLLAIAAWCEACWGFEGL